MAHALCRSSARRLCCCITKCCCKATTYCLVASAAHPDLRLGRGQLHVRAALGAGPGPRVPGAGQPGHPLQHAGRRGGHGTGEPSALRKCPFTRQYVWRSAHFANLSIGSPTILQSIGRAAAMQGLSAMPIDEASFTMARVWPGVGIELETQILEQSCVMIL